MAITVFLIIALIMSAVVHEVAHGWMAYRLGDSTAKDLGRLTLNPFKHLDLFGSIVLPAVLVLTKASFFLAWAKPVPYNPYRLRDARWGELKVALAGPLSNLILASFFGLTARFLPLAELGKVQIINSFFTGDNEQLLTMMSGSFLGSIFAMSVIFCILNLALMVFNLVPIPPLDGSKIASAFFSDKGREVFYRMEQYSLIILVVLIAMDFFRFITPLVIFLFRTLIGL
jgi:Zn-dependent protease